MFFEDFLKFLKEKSFSINEFKVLLAIYTILNESNIYGNVLLNLNKKTLSEKSGVDITNIGKIIKKLIEKNVLKNEDKNIYLNYSFFYRGSKIDYDLYTEIYNNTISNDLQNT
jgi:DNA-binding MarR family transcriptional regulator